MTIPGIMSLEYRNMLRAAAALDADMRALGWSRGKRDIRGPNGERLPPDTSDEDLGRRLAAFQSLPVEVEGLSKAA